MMKTGRVVIARSANFALCLAVIMGFGACVRGGRAETVVLPRPQQDCPVCPTCEEDNPTVRPTDPLADSEIDDGLTDTARREFISRNIKSTVRIHVSRYDEEEGNTYYAGTGSIIDDHHILTAGHVLENAEYVTATIRRLGEDGETIEDVRTFPVEIVVRDLNAYPDIAVLRVRHNEVLSDHMPLAPRGYELRHRQLLWHFGENTRWQRGPYRGQFHPWNRRETTKRLTILGCRNQGGDSGGPVVNTDGLQVGVILRYWEELSFFITIDEVRAEVTRMLGRPLF